jgi:hypothetical protein
LLPEQARRKQERGGQAARLSLCFVSDTPACGLKTGGDGQRDMRTMPREQKTFPNKVQNIAHFGRNVVDKSFLINISNGVRSAYNEASTFVPATGAASR